MSEAPAELYELVGRLDEATRMLEDAVNRSITGASSAQLCRKIAQRLIRCAELAEMVYPPKEKQ